MRATSSSLKIIPFSEGVAVSCDLEVSERQLEVISEGFIPKDMDDKWFIFYEKPYLYFHRSWTGQPVSRLRFSKASSGYQVTELLVSPEMGNHLESWGDIAIYMVRRKLLGEDVPFPKTPKDILGKKA